MAQHKYYYHALVLLAGLTWASLGVFSQLLHDAGVPLTDQVIWRLILAILGAGVAAKMLRQRLTLRAGEGGYMLVNGLIWALAYMTFPLAIYLGTPIAKAIAIVYSYPLTVVPLSYLVFREVPSRKNLAAIMLTLISLGVMFQVWQLNSLADFQMGDVMAFINSICAGAMIVWGTKFRRETKLPVMTSLFYSFLIALPLAIAGVWGLNQLGIGLYQMQIGVDHGISWLWLGGIAILSSIVPVGLLYAGSKHLKPAVTGVLLVTEPVWTYVAGLIFFGQQLDLWSIVGSLGILLSVLLV